MLYDNRPNVRLALTGLLVGAFVGACSTPDVSTLGKLCDGDRPCPDGLFCVEGKCSKNKGGNDASDAGSLTATLTLRVIGSGTTNPPAGAYTFRFGTKVQVSATSESGATFTGWSGATTGATNPVIITMDGSKTLTASFTAASTLTIVTSGNGTTNPPAGIYVFESGTTVQVAATPESGAAFTGWSGAATGTTNPVTLTMDGNKTLTANFTGANTLTIATSGNGTTSPSPGTHMFGPASTVQVTATPGSGAIFTGWSGAATGTTNPVTLTMDGNKTLTANFTGANTLTIATSGNGTTSPAAGSTTYASGTTVQVTATAGSGAVFTGWSGAATGTTNPVTLIMDGNKTLTASFTGTNTLTIATSGNGTTSPAAGSATYASGATVMVTATAGSGAVFTGWSGAVTGTTNPVTIVMDGNKALTANFATAYTLTIATSGSGTTSPAAGAYTYASGTAVQVTATPASGNAFTGWSGAATGTTNPVTITMDGNKSLTASFIGSYTLTIATSGSGTTSPAAGTYTYASGTAVQVTATPASGNAFTGWSGAATGTANPVTLTMDGNKTLTASFATNPTESYTLTIATSGTGTTSPGAGTYTYTSGTAVQVTAIPASGNAFTGWSGAATGTANPVTLTMDGNKTLTASFVADACSACLYHKLVWADEFNGSGQPSSGNWNYHVGNGWSTTAKGFKGWGNATGERQFYRPDQCYLQSGNLVIRGDYDAQYEQEIEGDPFYHWSCRITTQGKVAWSNARVEARIAMPNRAGAWPTFMLMGTSSDGSYTTSYSPPMTSYDTLPTNWPSCGGILVLEHPDYDADMSEDLFWDSRVGLYAHSDSDASHNATTSSVDAVNNFHVYAVEWNASTMYWYVDNVRVRTQSVSSSNMEEFKQSFFVILNMAIGTAFSGVSMSMTAYMYVDYVRVYQ